MITLIDIVKKSTEYLDEKGIETPRKQAEEVIGDCLGMKRLELYLHFERPLNDDEVRKCRAAIERRGKSEPYQYIKGSVGFLGCHIEVSPDVLIPRQETEILVSKIIETLSKEDLKGKTLWDVCCGSGCIAIAIKKHFPQLEVIASDLSEKALAVAKKNASFNHVEIKFLQGDLLTPFVGQKTHYFVCNPPYIAENEFSSLDPEVKDFEPKMALISGPSGLEVYERLAKALPEHLFPGAKIWLEMGFSQGEAVKSLFNWKKGRVEMDWSGKERFFLLENE